MAGIKSLFKDTVIYGLSSIVGRFLNWLLVPLYTAVFIPSEYGIVTYIYAIVAIAFIVLTYGMETAFFRFANHERYSDPNQAYSTSLMSVGFTSLLFMAMVTAFLKPITHAMNCDGHESYVIMMAVAVAVDAYCAIPFAYLRFKKRPMRFATLKLINIGLNIALNLFFILLCPLIWKYSPDWIAWFYRPDFGIGYIFLSNLIASVVVLLLLLPDIVCVEPNFNRTMLKEMLAYAFPLLILGLAGIMNQNLDKIFLPYLFPTKDIAMRELGIYGACGKIAVVMMMFTQAFRFAYEPFIFAQNKEKGYDKLKSYSDAMKYFVMFSLFIFLAVTFYLPILKYFINPRYFEGLRVVPIIMMADVFFGIFFNLSVWYKVTDRTIWGTWFSLIGLVIVVAVNIIFVPMFGYIACAWASFACYGTMMVVSYLVGQAKYPVNYHVPRLIFYFTVCIALYAMSQLIVIPNEWVNLSWRTLLLLIFLGVAVKRENIAVRKLIPSRRR
ncbi:MAG: oligosaccharide flippase family protein [Muribaculum sp.]|nr:oligosaccharide flippase family protein [Muribaculum sp.]